MEAINNFIASYPEIILYMGCLLCLAMHVTSVIPRPMFALYAIALVAAGMFFIVLFRVPEPIRFSQVVAMLLIYSTMLFILLSEAMIEGLAKFLTAKRGEKWTKELEYFYLAIGSVAILATINRIEFLTGRFERTDILAPVVLATAVVIRCLKTRAEIGGWNKPDFSYHSRLGFGRSKVVRGEEKD